ncbi:MAG: 2-hydroxychromene-2-carboxylate isomerase [Proteobacteria bacterium]|nr:2-hydroxychromene-2-carboxylate isomerase [Pseudomonadota bacterium]
MADIEYFYSAHSSFAYLGSARFMEIARAGNRRIAHRPIDLNLVVEATGPGWSGDRTPSRRAYFFGRDKEHWAEVRSVAMLGRRPTHHDNDMTLANCMVIAGIEQGVDVDTLAHAMLEAHWRDDADLADPVTLAALGARAGLDPEPLLHAARTPQTQAVYAANSEEAIRRSVFGSPTYFVDGDMFYGQDRLEMVERALAKPFAGSWPPAG